LNLPGDQKII